MSLNLLGKEVEYSPGRTKYRKIAGEEIPVASEDSGMIVKYALTQTAFIIVVAARSYCRGSAAGRLGFVSHLRWM